MYTEISLPSHSNVFTLPNIKCGTTIAFSISASNRVGHGMQSRPFNVKTLQGKTPIAPTQNEVHTIFCLFNLKKKKSITLTWI